VAPCWAAPPSPHPARTRCLNCRLPLNLLPSAPLGSWRTPRAPARPRGAAGRRPRRPPAPARSRGATRAPRVRLRARFVGMRGRISAAARHSGTPALPRRRAPTPAAGMPRQHDPAPRPHPSCPPPPPALLTPPLGQTSTTGGEWREHARSVRRPCAHRAPARAPTRRRRASRRRAGRRRAGGQPPAAQHSPWLPPSRRRPVVFRLCPTVFV